MEKGGKKKVPPPSDRPAGISEKFSGPWKALGQTVPSATGRSNPHSTRADKEELGRGFRCDGKGRGLSA